MIDHPAAHLFALITGILPGGLLLWLFGVTSWISWITLVITCLMFVPGAGIFIMGRFDKSSGTKKSLLCFLVPALMALALAGAITLLGGTGPEDHGLHWAWMILFCPAGMMVGMAGIFAGAAYGN